MNFLALRSPGFLPQSLINCLFESHWPWWIALALLGVGLHFLSRQRDDRRFLRGGQVLLALTVLWVIGSRVVDTPAERLRAVHVDLADAAAKADIDRLLSHLAPSFTAPALRINQRDPGNKEALGSARAEIADKLKKYGIKDSTITFYQSTLSPDNTAITELTLITQSDFGPVKTTWELSWSDLTTDDWKIIHARLLTLADKPISDFDMSQ